MADTPSSGNGGAPKPPALARAIEAVKYTISSLSSGTWMSPNQPLQPMAQQVKGRTWDFPVAFNLNYQPRAQSTQSFAYLKQLSDNCGILRTVIETRKDQMEGLDWIIRVRKVGGKAPALDANTEGRIRAITRFFRRPNYDTDWAHFLRQSMEQLFVYDALSLERVRNRGGFLDHLTVLDGSTITPMLDQNGRTPPAPSVAYQQILKGMPAVDFSVDDLLYYPRNRRVGEAYGYPVVAQIASYVELSIRRLMEQKEAYTTANRPRGFMNAPETMTIEQISAMQQYWDSIFSGNTAQRQKAWWVPHGTDYTPLEQDQLFDSFDEWLSRVICFAFSLPSLPFVKEQNRATAQVSSDNALAEGLQPTMQYMKRVIDHIIDVDFNSGDLEFAWDVDTEFDPAKLATINDTYVRNGTLSLDEARETLGREPKGGAFAENMVLTAAGYVAVDPADRQQSEIDLAEATAPPPPQIGPDGLPLPAKPGFPGKKPPFGAAKGSAKAENLPAGSKKPAGLAALATSGEKPPGAANARAAAKAKAAAEMKKSEDAGPYLVRRELINEHEVVAWAKSVGFVPPEKIMLGFQTNVHPNEAAPMMVADGYQPRLIKYGHEIRLYFDFKDAEERAEELDAPGFKPYIVVGEADPDLAEVLVGAAEASDAIYKGPLLFGAETVLDAHVLEKQWDIGAFDADYAPTDARIKAGNYKKGHLLYQGLDITIENPAGSARKGKGWQVLMPTHYGYIKGTLGADGDHVDVFVGPNEHAEKVFVIDQQDQYTKDFDEHKVMLGYDSWMEAKRAYDSCYEDGLSDRLIAQYYILSMDEFKSWLEGGDTTKPMSFCRDDGMMKMEVGKDRHLPFPEAGKPTSRALSRYSFDGSLAKYNEWHDPANGQFTFGPEGAVGSLQHHPLRKVIEEADRKLKGDAARAIDEFVGHEPGKIDKLTDKEDPNAFGIMSARRLEEAIKGDTQVAKDIEEVFAPVREQFRAEVGDEVVLYRVQHKTRETDPDRATLSWSSDPKFSDHWVGVKKWPREYSEDEILTAERAYKETGEAKLRRGYRLVEEEVLPGVRAPQIYRGNEHITDADSVRDFMAGENESLRDLERDNAKRREKIVAARIPLNDVLWITDRAGQSEFIVRNDAKAQRRINRDGTLSKAAPVNRILPIGFDWLAPDNNKIIQRYAQTILRGLQAVQPGVVATVRAMLAEDPLAKAYNPNQPRDEIGRWTAYRVTGAFQEPDSDAYHYHATAEHNLESIAEEGLRGHAPDYGTDQDMWPDGSTEERVYFGRPDNIWSFAPAEGDAVALRVKRGPGIRPERGTGDYVSSKPIGPEQLELKTSAGWVPLTALFGKLAKAGFDPNQPRDGDGKWTELPTKFKLAGRAPAGPINPMIRDSLTEEDRLSIKKLTGFGPEELTGILGRGVDGRVALIGANISDSGRTVELSWYVHGKDDADEEPIADFTRTWNQWPDGSVTVHHDSFFVKSGAQGVGLGRQLLGNMMATYEAAGVSRITVDAANTGAYAWAKFGFAPHADNWEHSEDRFNHILSSSGVTDLAGLSRLRDPANPKSIWRIADHPEGKKVLMDNPWSGSFEMSDPDALSRFYNYVGREPVRLAKAAEGMLDEAGLMLALIEDHESLAKAYDPNQPRDEFGRWTMVGSALPLLQPEDIDAFNAARAAHSKANPDDWDYQKWPVESVPVKDLVSTQASVERRTVAEKKSEKTYRGYVYNGTRRTDAVVNKWRGKYYIMDGHHTATAALEHGAPALVAHVLHLPDEVSKADVLAKASRAERAWRTLADRIAAALDLGDLEVIISDAARIGGVVGMRGGRMALAEMGYDGADDITNQIDERVLAWARSRAAEMVGMRVNARGRLVRSNNARMRIDEGTRTLVRNFIYSGLKARKSMEDIAKSLEGLGPYPFSEKRAQLIASTEIARAHGEGALEGARQAKRRGIFVKKYWMVADTPCPVCEGNAEEGLIDIDQPFQSGHETVPAHPICRCALGMQAGTESEPANTFGTPRRPRGGQGLSPEAQAIYDQIQRDGPLTGEMPWDQDDDSVPLNKLAKGGFDPNQPRAKDGKWSLERGQKAAAEKLGLPTTYTGKDSGLPEHTVDNPLPRATKMTLDEVRSAVLPRVQPEMERRVAIADLRSPQDYVMPSQVASYVSHSQNRPLIARKGGELIIIDGTHRTLAAKLRQESTIDVYDLGDLR